MSPILLFSFYSPSHFSLYSFSCLLFHSLFPLLSLLLLPSSLIISVFYSSFSPPSIFLLIPLHFLTFPFFLLPFSLSVYSSILLPSPHSLVRTPPPLPASFSLPFHSLLLSPYFPSFSYAIFVFDFLSNVLYHTCTCLSIP